MTAAAWLSLILWGSRSRTLGAGEARREDAAVALLSILRVITLNALP